jgi:hypothetical protein
MNGKLAPALSLFLLVALGAFIERCNAKDDGLRGAFGELDRELAEFEIELKQLDLQLTKAITYGWREDASDKIAEWRNSLKDALARFRTSMSGFFEKLTTRKDGERLPEWVYTAAGGALDEVVTYLEKRMANEDDHVRSIILEVLRNSIRVYRNKVRGASQQTGEAKEEL